MRAAESCLRAVLSVSPGPSATWEKRLEARRNAPAFLSTDLGDEDVGMGAACPLGTTLQVPQGSGVTRGGEGVPLLGTACMCVRVGGGNGAAGIRGLLCLHTWPGCPGRHSGVWD